ncbi:hypothetical protein T265_09431 [Opisthorchis viverrini]|uniref:Uncharacterized protein n=1 Tax=Opisthorchis viverrini TaxID=6198 RepID=A0A074ZA93_OPIVI|nr:hypothetical protein T265_09431 [Opisthorchis viverrini]KER22512.1 hypothetical protein T265_09431 [Opisthorchis viverrini]
MVTKASDLIRLAKKKPPVGKNNKHHVLRLRGPGWIGPGFSGCPKPHEENEQIEYDDSNQPWDVQHDDDAVVPTVEDQRRGDSWGFLVAENSSTVHDWSRLSWSFPGKRTSRIPVNFMFYLNPNCTKLTDCTHLQISLVLREAHPEPG